MKRAHLLLALTLVFAFGSSHATIVTPIDLNDFFFFPGDPVTVAPDGSSAILAESSTVSPIILSNDPGLGDPNVIIPQAGRLLSFDFDFAEGAVNNDDEFGAFLIDAATGSSVGAAFEFFTQSSSSGTVSFDLSTLTATILGLQFQLSALPGDSAFDSTLTVSNVRLVDPMPAPAPATFALLGLGLSGIGFQRRRKIKGV